LRGAEHHRQHGVIHRYREQAEVFAVPDLFQ
jgi:hypothetical protein